MYCESKEHWENGNRDVQTLTRDIQNWCRFFCLLRGTHCKQSLPPDGGTYDGGTKNGTAKYLQLVTLDGYMNWLLEKRLA